MCITKVMRERAFFLLR